MIIPTFRREKQLYKKGYRFVAGIDEVGRGPLAGPVIACAVVISLSRLKDKYCTANLPDSFYKKNNNVRDSKCLTPLQRERLYKVLTNDKNINYAVGIVSEKIIDKINILKASLLAMKKAVENLEIKPDFLLLDGRWTIKNYPVSQTAIPNGDKYVFSIAVASIIAKVTRDRLLVRYDKKYPNYGFARHKGYGTKLHLEMLKKYGPCRLHRKSFRPVREMV